MIELQRGSGSVTWVAGGAGVRGKERSWPWKGGLESAARVKPRKALQAQQRWPSVRRTTAGIHENSSEVASPILMQLDDSLVD